MACPTSGPTTEHKERAERIATLFFGRGTTKANQLADNIAKELYVSELDVLNRVRHKLGEQLDNLNKGE